MTEAFFSQEWAQLEDAERITDNRRASWQHYHESLEGLEAEGLIRRPIVPDGCQHNGHMYYILLDTECDRQRVLDEFKRNDIWPVFHYVPLHESPAGKRYGRIHGEMNVTVTQSERLVRLPLWVGITQPEQDRVIEVLNSAVRS